jgi:UDP-hydrolysing UDP-N-acetyl-D-glucosamine 2-epimerase
MSTRKIAVFVGSRANYGRLKSVCKAIQESDALELILILGASFYNAEVEFPVASRIQCLIGSDDHEAMALTTGVLLTKVAMELERLKPDIVLVHGDRYEVLAVAQAAAYMNIPLAHTEGGEVTGCIDDKVRNAITALTDIHFPVTEMSFRRILHIMGYDWTLSAKRANNSFDYDNVYIVGSTAFDGINNLIKSGSNGIVVLHHPDTATKEDITPLIEAVSRCSGKVTWVNPNIDAGYMEILKKLHGLKWDFKKNLPVDEYLNLLYSASVVVGNSSSFIKECSYMGVPAVIVGSRQAGREMDCNATWVQMEKEPIFDAIVSQYGKAYKPSTYFGDGTASQKIVKVLAEVEL